MFDSIPSAIASLQDGNFIIVVDDESRENEGDLIIAAEHMNSQKMAFMVRHTTGIICCALKQKRLNELFLPLMVQENTDSHKTAFTITVDYKHGTTTGVSAQDRSITCNKLADAEAKAQDFNRPGHLFPLQYTEGGVLTRRGHTEASVDLMEASGLYPAGVLSEIVREDGEMARRNDLIKFAKEQGLKLITIEDLVKYLSVGK